MASNAPRGDRASSSNAGQVAAGKRLPAFILEEHAAGRLRVAAVSDLFEAAGAPIAPASHSILMLTPDAPSRRTKAVPVAHRPAPPSDDEQPMHVQWEGAEHTYLGDGVTLRFDGGAGLAKDWPLRLDNGLRLTYGQVVSLGADFYGLPDTPISDGNAPELFVRAYATLARDPAAASEAPRILAVMQVEIDRVNQAIRAGEQPSTVYAALGDSLSAKWNVITGGGSAVSDLVPLGRYLKLAETNWDHFGVHALTCYRAGHGVALNAALSARRETDQDRKTVLLQRAYAMNAFADHFLTDLFSSGHLRTPRKELYQVVTPSSVGSLLSRYMHDEDSALGLNAVNARGDKWMAYGDKRLLDGINRANLAMVQAAIQASVGEVWSAYETGRSPSSPEALTYVPDLNAFADPSRRENGSPLFVWRKGTVQRRKDTARRSDYSWTSNWWGWSTLALLESKG